MMAQSRLDKLPVWAQEHIRMLEQRNAELARENHELRCGTEPSRVALNDPVGRHAGKPGFFFRPDTQFQFLFGRDGAIVVGFNGDDQLEVRAVGNASPVLTITPRMSNVACVEPRVR
jgi:hypothetical protein